MRQKVRRLKVVESILSYTCNGCGKEEGEHDNDIHPFTVSGGWGSTYPQDRDTLSFELCGDCLRKITATFKIPPEEEEDDRPVFLGAEPYAIFHGEWAVPWAQRELVDPTLLTDLTLNEGPGDLPLLSPGLRGPELWQALDRYFVWEDGLEDTPRAEWKVVVHVVSTQKEARERLITLSEWEALPVILEADWEGFHAATPVLEKP